MTSDFLQAAAAGRWRGLSGRTLLFPVVGHPVTQVRAPSVLNRLFAEAGIDAVSFGLELPPAGVAAACQGLLASASIGGLLVTIPYKKTLHGIAANVGRDAALVGAVNALRREADGSITGDLFDGAGFVAGLQAAGHALAGRNVLLLGAGGAGSAIAAALGGAGIAALGIYDPQPGLASALAAQLQPAFPQVKIAAPGHQAAAACDIVINASPLGLRAEDPLPTDLARLAPGTLVCDIIMEPETTRLLATARALGLPVHAGRAMFDHQLPSYLRFFGFPELARRVRIAGDVIDLRPAPAFAAGP